MLDLLWTRFLIYDFMSFGWFVQVASFPLLYALACWVLSGSKLTIRLIRDIVCTYRSRVVEMALFNLNKIDAEIALAMLFVCFFWTAKFEQHEHAQHEAQESWFCKLSEVTDKRWEFGLFDAVPVISASHGGCKPSVALAELWKSLSCDRSCGLLFLLGVKVPKGLPCKISMNCKVNDCTFYESYGTASVIWGPGLCSIFSNLVQQHSCRQGTDGFGQLWCQGSEAKVMPRCQLPFLWIKKHTEQPGQVLLEG